MERSSTAPNDIIVASNGTIYFSDPSFGRMEYYGVQREPELDVRGVYKLDPDHRDLTLLADDFDQPNGLTLSPGRETTLRQRYDEGTYSGLRCQ